MYLLRIRFSRITPANLNGSGSNFTGVYVGRTQISCVKILAPWLNGHKMAAKRWSYYVAGTTNSHFFVTGQIGMNSGKRQSVCSKNSEKFSIKRLFCLKTAILGCFDGPSCHRPTCLRLGFSIRGMAKGVPAPNPLFCATYRFCCRSP